MKLTIHREQTGELKVELDKYFQKRGIIASDKHFNCPHHRECREGSTEFYPAVLPHVGSNYAIDIDGKPFRILFIGKEALKEKPKSMDARTKQIKEAGQEKDHRNPHMAGTALALKMLFNMDIKSDNEIFENDHIFNYMALTNATLCHYVKDGKTKRNVDMLDSCAEHLTYTIHILKPTIVIFQGSFPGAGFDLANFRYFFPNDYPLEAPYAKQGSVGNFTGDYGIYESIDSNLPRFIIKLYHPVGNRKPGENWKAPHAKYFLSNVKPALEYVRKRIIG